MNKVSLCMVLSGRRGYGKASMTSKTLQHATEAADGTVSYDTISSNSVGALLVGTSIKTGKPPCTCDGNPLAFSSTHRNKICSVALLRAWVPVSGIGSG